MRRFAYRALDGQGRISCGALDAADAADLESRLRRLGLELVSGSPSGWRAIAHARRVSRRELIDFCFHLSHLLRAGIGIVEALADLRDSLDAPPFRHVLASVVADIEGGQPLSRALAAHPLAFDAVFVALVHAGEHSGRLDAVLDELCESLKWQDEMAGQAWRALTYPAIALAVVVAVIVALMVFLVPQLAVTFKALSPTLPRETEFLIAISRAFVQHGPLLVVLPAALGVALWAAARKSERLRRAAQVAAIRMPVVGEIRFKIVLARFASCFALLYRSGISVLDGLRICERITGNRLVEEALQGVGRAISEGQGISQAFAATRLFPPLVLRMLRVGETTGGLDAALLNVSDFYSREAREGMARLQGLIGPASTLVLGGLIAAILYAVFLPLYDVIGRARF